MTEEFDRAGCDQGPRLVFPWRLEQTTWEVLKASVPLISRSLWEDRTLEGMSLQPARENLGIDMGMSEEEQRNISGFIDPNASREDVREWWM